MRRLLAAFAAVVVLAGCREVRVNQVRSGTTAALGPREVAVIRDRKILEAIGVSAPVDFRKEFVVVLLMGPHSQTGYSQVVEAIRANSDRVRIVAFERPPLDGGEPAPKEYRTYTLWIVPNSVYRSGSKVEVVSPSGEAIASTTLR
ncbi:MAG TPA: hypothetical protein VGN14_16125 [Candidatus Elarobacter sp.]|jgi:hypothetical protein